MIQCVVFCDKLLSLSVVFSSFTHIVACVSNVFIDSCIPLCGSTTFYLFISWRLSCGCHFLTIMNDAATNTHVQVFVWHGFNFSWIYNQKWNFWVVGVKYYVLVVLICISMKVNDVEHLLMYLLAIYVSLEKFGENWYLCGVECSSLWTWDISFYLEIIWFLLSAFCHFQHSSPVHIFEGFVRFILKDFNFLE